jgi:structural maintenance of chromosome 4
LDEKTLGGQANLIRDKVATLRSDVNSTQQQGGLVSALMTAKNKGEVTGVYGRLGEFL